MKRILSLLLLSILSFACVYAHDIPEGKFEILGVRTQISGKQTPAKTVSDMYIKVKNNTIQFVSDGYTMYLVSISEPPMLIEDKKAYPCIDAKTGNKTLIVYYTEDAII